MAKNEYIIEYNENLFNQIRSDMLGFIDVHTGIYAPGKHEKAKLPKIIKPKQSISLLDKKVMDELINIYSNKCQDIHFDSMEIYELNNENEFTTTFNHLKHIVDNLTYSNIIKLKNIENSISLKPLYLTNYLINYTSKISPSDRLNHVFNEDKFTEYQKRFEKEFSKDFKIITNESEKLFDFTKIFLDLNSIIGVFWKFCTINKIFESLANSLSFTRILQDFSSEINKKKNDLRYSFKEKDKRQIRSFASTGGLARAEKYREKMTPIFDEVFALFQSRKWKSKAECAKYFIKEFYLKNPDAAIELDSKKLVTEITNRINDRSTSRKVILLADR